MFFYGLIRKTTTVYINKASQNIPWSIIVSRSNLHCRKFDTTIKTTKHLRVPSFDVSKSAIHTTRPNKALPPIIWLAIRQFVKFGAVITGRGLRKWWSKLPQNKRQYLLQKIQHNRRKIIWATFSIVVAGYVYYIIHLVDDPITKRKKLLLFSENHVLQISNIESAAIFENYKGQIITSGYYYSHVLLILRRILNANKNLPGTERNWRVFIINGNDTVNAFVLPSGEIFIFTGMLKSVSNVNQLAAIVSHEMAHVLLCHTAERLSQVFVLDLILLLPALILWALLPDSVAIYSHFLTKYISSILFKLPFSRELEIEADTVGLEMMSRACYDPREANIFWKSEAKKAEGLEIEWLSTHPSHKERYKKLEAIMPQALKILSVHCPNSDIYPRNK